MDQCKEREVCQWWWCNHYSKCLLLEFEKRKDQPPIKLLNKVRKANKEPKMDPAAKKYADDVMNWEERIKTSNVANFSAFQFFPEQQTKKNKTATTQKNINRRKRIWERSSGICYLCGNPVAFEEFTIEHVTPVSLGGTSELNNLRAAHFDCNQLKGSKTLDEFLSYIASKTTNDNT